MMTNDYEYMSYF